MQFQFCHPLRIVFPFADGKAGDEVMVAVYGRSVKEGWLEALDDRRLGKDG